MVNTIPIKDIQNFLEKEEVIKILEQAEHHTRNYIAVRIMWEDGLRISEVCHMQYKHIEFDNNIMNIINSKNKKSRRVPLNNDTKVMIRGYCASKNITGKKLIFPISRQQLFKAIKKYMEDAKIRPSASPHTLRHSFAINWVRQNGDIRRLQLIMGHSKIETTAVYLQFKDKDKKEAHSNVSFY